MYICPNCQEEVSDEIRRKEPACPFCHEPWPPLEEPEAEGPAAKEAAPKPAASAAGQAPGPMPAEPAEAVEQPKGSKTKWVVLFLALVAAGGAAAYFLTRKGGGTKGPGTIELTIAGQKVSVSRPDEEDYQTILQWQRDVRGAIVKYLADQCDSYRRHRFKIDSKLVEREMLLSTKKKIQILGLKVTLKKAQPLPLEGYDWFSCPYVLAYVHKEHAIHITMEFTEKERVLGPTLRLAKVTIQGGRFVEDKGTYTSPWNQGGRKITFPKFKKLKAEHPAVAVLSGKLFEKQDATHMKYAGIPFHKTKRLEGKSYLVGRWEATLTSKKFLEIFRSWVGGCGELQSKIKEINEKYPEESFKVPALKTQAVEMARQLCKGIRKIAEGLSPWNASQVREGADRLSQAKKIGQEDIDRPIEVIGMKIKSSDRPAPWCGGIDKPSPCPAK